MPVKVHASGFAAVPYALLDQAPDPYVVHVYAVLHRHGWASKQGAWMSIETIRRQTSIGARVIRRSLSWLKEAGWVDAQPRSGATTVYYVRIDTPCRSDTPAQSGTPSRSDRGPLADRTGDPLLIGQTNKNPETRTHKQEPSNRNAKPAKGRKRDPLATRNLPDQYVPVELIECADLLAEFWSVKKGTRSTSVFNRICRKLVSWSAADRQQALERAISNGWGDVFDLPQERVQRPVYGTSSRSSSYQDQFDRSQIDWDALNGKSFFPNAIPVVPTNQ